MWSMIWDPWVWKWVRRRTRRESQKTMVAIAWLGVSVRNVGKGDLEEARHAFMYKDLTANSYDVPASGMCQRFT